MDDRFLKYFKEAQAAIDAGGAFQPTPSYSELAAVPTYDDPREQAIMDSRLKNSGNKVADLMSKMKKEREIEQRRQLRAYAEQADPEIVKTAKELQMNVGDRRKRLEIIRKLKPEQRDEVLRVAAGVSQQMGDDRGSYLERFGGALSRGVANVSQPIMEMIGTGGTQEEIDYIRNLDAIAAQEFDPSRPSDPWYERGSLQAAQMAPWMATVVGGAGTGRAAFQAGGKLLTRGAAAGIPGAKTALQAAGVVGKAPTLLGGQAATAESVLQGAGSLSGVTAASFPGMYVQEVDALRELGMPDDIRLRALAAGTAAVGGAIEGIIPNPFSGLGVSLKNGAMRAARDYLRNALLRAPVELSEEYLQGVTSGLGEHVAQYIASEKEFDFGDGEKVSGAVKSKSVADAFKKGWEQTKEAALPMAFLLGAPAAYGAGLSAARASVYKPDADVSPFGGDADNVEPSLSEIRSERMILEQMIGQGSVSRKTSLELGLQKKGEKVHELERLTRAMDKVELLREIEARLSPSAQQDVNQQGGAEFVPAGLGARSGGSSARQPSLPEVPPQPPAGPQPPPAPDAAQQPVITPEAPPQPPAGQQQVPQQPAPQMPPQQQKTPPQQAEQQEQSAPPAEIPLVKTAEDYDAVPMYGVYQTVKRGKKVYAAKLFEDFETAGNTFDTAEEAAADAEQPSQAPIEQVPDSVLAAFPDMRTSTEGYINLNGFTQEERDALRNAGFVENILNKDGNAYEGVDTERLWAERQRRQASYKAKRSQQRDAEREILNGVPTITEEEDLDAAWDQLSDDAKNVLREWTLGSGKSGNTLGRIRGAAKALWQGIKGALESDVDLLREIFENGKIGRDKIRKQAGENGKIVLLRGLRKGQLGSRPVVESFTTDLRVARNFAGQDGTVERVEVDPDDVIYVIGGAESEVLVKNTKSEDASTPSLTPEQQVESDRQFAEQKAAEQQPAPMPQGAANAPVSENPFEPQVAEQQKAVPAAEADDRTRGERYFAPSAIEEARKESSQPKSRSTLIEMSPDQFLEMAEKLDGEDAGVVSQDKAKTVSEVLESGKQFSSIPYLGFKVGKDGKAKVVSHEGRHRAMQLKKLGVKSMPVMLTGPIRWSEQTDPNSMDRVEQWPSTLQGETSGEMAFPVADPLVAAQAPVGQQLPPASQPEAAPVTGKRSKKLVVGDTIVDGKTGEQLTVDKIIHPNWGLAKSGNDVVLVNLNNRETYERGSRERIIEKMKMSGMAQAADQEENGQAERKREPKKPSKSQDGKPAKKTSAQAFLEVLTTKELKDLAATVGVQVSGKTKGDVIKELLGNEKVAAFLKKAAPKKKSSGKKRKAAPKGDKGIPKEMQTDETVEVSPDNFNSSEKKQDRILKRIGIRLRITKNGNAGLPASFDPDTSTIWIDRDYVEKWNRKWKKAGKSDEAMTWGLFSHEMFHAIKNLAPKTWNRLYNWVSGNDAAALGRAKVAYLADMLDVFEEGLKADIETWAARDPDNRSASSIKIPKNASSTEQVKAVREAMKKLSSDHVIRANTIASAKYVEDVLKNEDIQNDEGLSRYLEDRAGSFKFWNKLGEDDPGLLARVGRWIRRVLGFAESDATDPRTLAGQTRMAIERAMKKHNADVRGGGGRRASPERNEFDATKINVDDIRAKDRPGRRVSKGLAVKSIKGVKIYEETDDLSFDYVKKNAPSVFIKNANLLADYPLVRGKRDFAKASTVEQAQEIYDVFVREVADNLNYLYSKYDSKLRVLSTLWYDGANAIANRLAKRYEVSPEQAAGIIAAMSPQKDWYQNVRLAELLLEAFNRNPVMTAEMIAYQRDVVRVDGLKEYTRKVRRAEGALAKLNLEYKAITLENYRKAESVLSSMPNLQGGGLTSAESQKFALQAGISFKGATGQVKSKMSPEEKAVLQKLVNWAIATYDEGATSSPGRTLSDSDIKRLVSKRRKEIKSAIDGSAASLEVAKAKLKNATDKSDALVSKLENHLGQTLDSVPEQIQAYMVRLYHEVNTTKDYDVIAPDGSFVEIAKNDSGENSRLAWGSFGEIGKGVSIRNNGSQKNITRRLGQQHKIRNFYNNIIDPMSKDGDVTMDTHAIAAALLMALSGNSAQVTQNFGGSGAKNKGAFGIKGLYYAFAEAYNVSAKENGILPRQMQSATWDPVRGLFTDVFKSSKANVAAVNAIWERYANGEITIDEARRQVFETAGGIDTPTWARPVRDDVGGSVREKSNRAGVRRNGQGSVGPAAGRGGRGDGGRRASPRRNGRDATTAIRSRVGLDGRVWDRSQDRRAVGKYGVVASYRANENDWVESGVATPTFIELQKSADSVGHFVEAITAARESHGALGASVYVYPEEDYRNMRLFLTEDGKAGFALKDSGEAGITDIVSVFNTNGEHLGVSYSLIRLAVEQGGNVLDAFDTFLPKIYSANGFRAIARTKWNDEFAPDGWNKKDYESFNNGEPDVVFMAYDPQRFDIYRNDSGEGEVFDDYDKAVASQRSVAKKNYLDLEERKKRDAKAKRSGRRASVARRNEGLRSDPGQDRSVPARGVRSESPSYGEPREGAVSYVGRHYSTKPQISLSGKAYGTGVSRFSGGESKRLRQSDDNRIKNRVYFYIDTAGEIKPEMGVGEYAHEVKLNNLYDPASKLIEYPGNDNDFESAVIDAGFDGYIAKPYGMAVLLGPQHTEVPVRRATEYDIGQAASKNKEISDETQVSDRKGERASPGREDKRGRPESARDGKGRDQSRSYSPLAGAPYIKGATGPDPKLVSVAERYARDNGIILKRQAEYVTVDEDRAKRIADAYEQMAHDPQDPKVKEAYQELAKQTKAQYDALIADGYTFTFYDNESDPYAGNPSNAMRDLRKNKSMAVYGTFAGFGTEGVTSGYVEDNPLLADTGVRWKDQSGVERPVNYVELFRAVHDTFGHGLEGAGFRARGEENAWQAHVRLFTGSAIGAMTSGTRGQNSWLNYGPYGEKNRTAKVEDTIFADQKTGLMPEWTWTEGRAADMEDEAGESMRYSPGRQAKRKRDPEVTKAAQDLKAGLIDRDQYQRIVDVRMPLRKFEEVPTPASREDMIRGLANYKAGTRLKRDLIQDPEAIAAGVVLESRLDIPAYENEDVWVVTLHEPRSNIKKGTAAKVVAFTPTAVLKNVTFGVTEEAALNIAAGKPKATIATMRGEYVPMTAKQAYKLAEANKDRWVEIGMNPIRHTYFYDKDTQNPVVSAEEVVQVGGMVLAKNPAPGQREGYRYSAGRSPGRRKKKADILSELYDFLEKEGLAKPKEAEPRTTSIKNRKTGELRAEAGFPPRIRPVRQSFESWEEEARRQYPTAKDRLQLIARAEKDPEKLGVIESAAIGQHITYLDNQREAGKDVGDELLRTIKVSESIGTEGGRFLVSRRVERFSDYSLAGLIREHIRTVGEDPTEEQMQEYAELADRIKKLEADNRKLARKLARETIRRKKAEASQEKTPKPQPKADEPKKGTKKATIAKKVSDAFSAFKNLWGGQTRPAAGRSDVRYSPERQIESSDADIRYSPGRQQPADAKSAADNVVAALREAGVSSLMELESQVRANIPNVSAEQMQLFKDSWDASVSKESVESPIGSNPDNAALGARAKELLKIALELGYGAKKENWMEAVDAVHSQLSLEVPGITKYQTMQAISDYGVWRELDPEEIAVKTRAIRGKARQSLKIEDTLKAITQSEEWLKAGVSPNEVARRLRDRGLLPKATGQERATPDSIERDLIAEFNKLKKTLPVPAESREGQLKSALSTAKTAANNRLEMLDKDIAALQEAVKNRKPLVKPVAEKTALQPDEELANLRSQLEEKRRQRDELKAQYEKIFPSTKPKKGRKPLTDEQRLEAAMKMLRRQIDAVKGDVEALEGGTWAPAAKKPGVTSSRMEELKSELAALREIQRQARKASPEYQAKEEAKYWERYRKTQERRLAFWERRRDEAKAGRLPVPLQKRTITENEILQKNLEIEEAQYEAMIAIEKAKRATWNYGQWIGQGILEATSLLPKTLMLGMEMSFVLRQGFFYTYSQPTKAIKALVEALPAVFSQRLALASMESLDNRPNAKEYELAKVDFTRATGPQAKLEELYQSAIVRWLENTETKLLLPLRTWAKLYAMAERGNRTFSNIMKADMYDIQKRDTLAAREFFGLPTDWSQEDIKETGRISNIFSGRGTGLRGGNPWLDWLFLARRWTWSRIQADFIVPFQLVTPQWIGQWNADRGMRVALAKLYIRALVGHAAKMAAAYFVYSALADDDEEKPTMEFDLRSSDAFALKIGETRFKDEGGLMPAIVLASRIMTGTIKTGKGEIKSIYGEDVQYGGQTAADFLINYGRYKLGTAPSAILEWISGRDAVGNVVSKTDILTSRITPLTYREIYAAESELGLKRGTLAALEAFFGVSVATHGERSKYKKSNEQERKKKFESDLKAMEWDTPDFGYADLLSDAEQKQMLLQREAKRQAVVYAALASPTRKTHKSDESFQQSVKERDAAAEKLRKMGVDFNEARAMLLAYYKRQYGSAYEMRSGAYLPRESYTLRLRQLRKVLEQQE